MIHRTTAKNKRPWFLSVGEGLQDQKHWRLSSEKLVLCGKDSITNVCTEHTRLGTMLGLKTTANVSLFLFCFSFVFQVSGWFPMSWVAKDNLEHDPPVSWVLRWDIHVPPHPHVVLRIDPKPPCMLYQHTINCTTSPAHLYILWVLGFHFALSSVSWIANP